MAESLELRLEGAAAPDGEIPLADLAAIAKSLQELSLRVTRASVGAADLGRPNADVAGLSQVRLSGIRAGSTRLILSRGEPDVLDIDPAQLSDLDQRFLGILQGIGQDRRPDWVSDTVADSASDFVNALQAAAPVVVARLGDRLPIRIETRKIRKETWQGRSAQAASRQLVVAGRLEAVDLRSGKFRIVDDVGHRIALEDVPEAQAVAYLIAHRVEAEGPGILSTDGRLKGLWAPTIREAELPEPWTVRAAADLTEELAKPGPAYGEGIDLTDEEYADFLSFVRG
jgi:hypothetical protein